MKNYIFKAIVVTCFLMIDLYSLNAQCGASKCSDAEFLCSIRELDGLTCQAQTNPDGFNCSGATDYITYWRFIAAGDNSITITPLVGCNTNSTLLVTLAYECSCNPVTTVLVSNSPKTINFTSGDCERFNLSIQNTSNSNCQYQLNILAPKIPADFLVLEKINNDQDGIINFCPSTCLQKFSVGNSGFSDNCYTRYHWTLDGVILPKFEYRNSGNITFKMPGTFEVCVFATLEPKKNNVTCYQTPTVCATVVVENKIPRFGNSIRNICSENLPHSWGSNKIMESGTYSSQFNIECCTIDSIVEFNIIYPELEDTHYISCDGNVYVDPITKVLYPECFSRKKIVLPKYQDLACNNSYYLSTSYPKIKPKWIINNINGSYEIDPNIQINDLCDAQIGIENYGWFKKSDPQQTIISKSKTLTISTPDNYCLNYLATINLGPESQVCLFTFCEPFTQSPVSEFNSNKQIMCPGSNVTFTEQCSQDVTEWHWELPGAEPNESTLRNPTVYYDKPGIYPVKLIVENQYFSSTITKTQYINVVNSPVCRNKERRKRKFPVGSEFDREQLELRKSTNHRLEIIPNPNNGNFKIFGIPEYTEQINISIYNLLGVKVFETLKIQASDGIDLSDIKLSSGTYWIQIGNNEFDEILKLVLLQN